MCQVVIIGTGEIGSPTVTATVTGTGTSTLRGRSDWDWHSDSTVEEARW
jgi:hypothetical protein